jgi:response regulator of citrate/malate metabolism
MSDESEKEMKSENVLGDIDERLSKMEKMLIKMEKMLSSTINKVNSLEESTNDKFVSLEERLKTLVSPIRPPTRRSFEGLAGLTTVTPAMNLTRTTVIELAERDKKWVSVEDVAKETGRSPSTESAYLKLLSRVGAINRKAVYEGIGANRRVRKYVYRARR